MTWDDGERDLADVFDRAVQAAPRSRQRAVGSSQLGEECSLTMLHNLNGDREPRVPYSQWQSACGTAIHQWAQAAFEADNERLGRTRWLTERRVRVGSYAGRDVYGTVDVVDLDRLEVVDLKTASASSMRRHRAEVGQGHDVQRQCYGRAMALLGLEPRTVANWYVPRDGQLTSAFVMRAPFDESVAERALERAADMQARLDAAGGQVDDAFAAAGYEHCSRPWCPWCPRAVRSASIFG